MARYKIIYEDDWLIVVDKASGLLVIPTARKNTIWAFGKEIIMIY